MSVIKEFPNNKEINNATNSIFTAKKKCYHVTETKEESDEDVSEEKKWRYSHLCKSFKSLELQHLYKKYTERVSHGFFTLFLILQFCLSTAHCTLILVFRKNDLAHSLQPILMYGTTAILCLCACFLNDNYMHQHPRVLKIFSYSAYVILLTTNESIPLINFFVYGTRLRPAYTGHLILCGYVFFFIEAKWVAMFLGFLTFTCHILTLWLITYWEKDDLFERVSNDAIFYLCIIGWGMYYRYMNEIIKMRGFLDKRAYVISNLQLKYEEQQEESLMASIIPRHIIDEVKKDFLKSWTTTECNLKDFYTKEYDNVSILYADIVNYTEMTSKLNINELLITLNELFGRFDDASVELNVLRIKFLGDCYYCVSGIPPDPAPNHAEACVDLGLKMISIITQVRQKRNLNINMRIGIHSGKIIGGIIGRQKLQYDIWSNDVDIANKMETEGIPGMVHITDKTKDLLTKPYIIIPTSKGETDSYFKKNGLRTFLISPKTIIPEKSIDLDAKMPNKNNNRRPLLTNLFNVNETHEEIPSKSFIEAQIENQESKTIEDLKSARTTLYRQRSTILHSSSGSLMSMNSDSGLSSAEPSRANSTLTLLKQIDFKHTSTDPRSRTAFMNHFAKYEKHLRETGAEMEKAINNLNMSKYRQWFKEADINAFFQFFKKWEYEKKFLFLPDPLFKYYLISEFVLIICLCLMEMCTKEWEWAFWPVYVTFATFVFVLLPATWIYYLWTKYYNLDTEDIEKHTFMNTFFKVSRFINNNLWIRLGIFQASLILFSMCVFYDIRGMDCEDIANHQILGVTSTTDIFLVTKNSKDPLHCTISWYMSQTCLMAIFAAFLFIRINFWIKFICSLSITITYAYFLWNFNSDKFFKNETYNSDLEPKISHLLSIIFLTFDLVLIDRQTEYMNRMDFLWSERLKEEKQITFSHHNINKKLLCNILPEHVADIYLDRSKPSTNLYHEKYLNVAVMFASIVGYSSNDVGGEELLTVMNQIICKFDKVNMTQNFGRPIEKIKVAKWTYMAACQLKPGIGEDETVDPCHNVVSLVKFASAIMKQLQKINKTFYHFKLRIGISNGEILAGVVGSKKPLYDIWGDAVNMASRMDTTGEENKIQVLKHTALILQTQGFSCTYRAMIEIKGKEHPLPTYFVDLDKHFDLVRR